jgi:hypothetical protein
LYTERWVLRKCGYFDSTVDSESDKNASFEGFEPTTSVAASYSSFISRRRKKALGPFFEHFFNLGGPRGFRQKKLHKMDSVNHAPQQHEKLTCTYIRESVLIIDCHWHEFGGMGDRFDPESPPSLVFSFKKYS